jgi:ribonucleoside-diphosphate reductase alpha chain
MSIDKDIYQFKQNISKEIFEKKYMFKDETNVNSVIRDISKEISSCEVKPDIWEEKFYNQIINQKLIPAGRIMANARPNNKLKNYFNCFAISIKDDSIQEIYHTITDHAIISKNGGGAGLNLTVLRPKNDKLSGGGSSSGPISFLKIFDRSSEVIHTGGSRRAALLAILNDNHPDIEEFINCKKGDDNKQLTQANISIGITDDFINAIENDLDWELKFNNKVYKTVKARYLYDLFIKNVFIYNEPGIYNIDNIHKESNSYYLYKIIQSNACSEQPLPPNGACNLSSIKLSTFVKEPFTNKAYFDEEEFKETVRVSIRFLNNVFKKSDYILPEIQNIILNENRVGLGITAYADTLFKLGITYGSTESFEFIHKIGSIMRDTAYRYSIELSKEYGSIIPEKDREKYINSGFCKRLPEDIRQDILKYGIRNMCLLTIAPTGTTSLSYGQNCSSGIEPIFSKKYIRKIRQSWNTDDTEEETVYNEAWLDYIEYCKNNNITYDENTFPNGFITTPDVIPESYIETISIWQKYIDSSISCTLNLKPGTTINEFKDLFILAYKKGLKGLTTFNPDGYLKPILSSNNNTKKDNSSNIIRQTAPIRPIDLPCDIHTINLQNKIYNIIVGKLNDSLYEIFADDNLELKQEYTKGIIRKIDHNKFNLIISINERTNITIENISKEFNNQYNLITRLMSTALRHGTPLEFILKQIEKASSDISFERALTRVLKTYIKFGEGSKQICPQCGEPLINQDGCKTCISCGWSKCEDNDIVLEENKLDNNVIKLN